MKIYTTLSLLIMAAGLFYAEIHASVVGFDVDAKRGAEITHEKSAQEHDSEEAKQLLNVFDGNTNIRIRGVQNIILDYLQKDDYILTKILLTGYRASAKAGPLELREQVPVLSHNTYEDSPITHICYFFDRGQQLIAINNLRGKIIVMDAKKHTCELIPTPDKTYVSAFSSQGTHLAISAVNKGIFIIDLHTRKTVKKIPYSPSLASIENIYFSAQDTQLIAIKNATTASISIFGINLKNNAPPNPQCIINLNDIIMDSSINTDHNLIVMRTPRNKMYLLEKPFNNGNCIAYDLSKTQPNLVRLSPNSRELITGNYDGSISVYDIAPTGITHKQTTQMVSHHGVNALEVFDKSIVATSKRLNKSPIITHIHTKQVATLPFDQEKPTIEALYEQRKSQTYTDDIDVIPAADTIISADVNHQRFNIYRKSYDVAFSTPQPAPPWWRRFASKFSTKNMIRAVQYTGGAIGLGSLYMAHKQPQHAQYHGTTAALGFGATALSMLLQKYYKQPRPAR